MKQIIQFIEKIKPFIRSMGVKSGSIPQGGNQLLFIKKNDIKIEEEKLILLNHTSETSNNISVNYPEVNDSGNILTKNVERRIAINKNIEGLPNSELAKSSAIDELIKRYPNAEIKEMAIIRPWERKRIEKWSDNTKSFWDVWVTEETTVQIIAQLNESTCKLFTIHVERRINPTGTFSHCYSHIIFEDELS